MAGYTVELVSDVQVKWRTDAKTARRLRDREDAVELRWQRIAMRRGKAPHNGTLLSALDVHRENGSACIKGCFVEYRHYLAQREDPPLSLGIQPVGVSGLVVFKSGGKKYTVLAKRSHSTTQYPGYLELVPSGGIESVFAQKDGSVDYRSQLVREFEEETGLGADKIRNFRPVALILDAHDQVYDVCCVMEVEAAKTGLRKSMKKCDEYEEPLFIDCDGLVDFAERNERNMVPTSLALIRAVAGSL